MKTKQYKLKTIFNLLKEASTYNELSEITGLAKDTLQDISEGNSVSIEKYLVLAKKLDLNLIDILDESYLDKSKRYNFTIKLFDHDASFEALYNHNLCIETNYSALIPLIKIYNSMARFNIHLDTPLGIFMLKQIESLSSDIIKQIRYFQNAGERRKWSLDKDYEVLQRYRKRVKDPKFLKEKYSTKAEENLPEHLKKILPKNAMKKYLAELEISTGESDIKGFKDWIDSSIELNNDRLEEVFKAFYGQSGGLHRRLKKIFYNYRENKNRADIIEESSAKYLSLIKNEVYKRFYSDILFYKVFSNYTKSENKIMLDQVLKIKSVDLLDIKAIPIEFFCEIIPLLQTEELFGKLKVDLNKRNLNQSEKLEQFVYDFIDNDEAINTFTLLQRCWTEYLSIMK